MNAKINSLIKGGIVIIPLAIIGFILYSNFVASGEFEYNCNIGEEKDNYLSPLSRVSERIDEDVNYRKLTSGLVYFNVPIVRGADKVSIEVRFKDNFPENGAFILGVKDEEDWHYRWKSLYKKNIGLDEFENNGKVHRVNPKRETINIDGLNAAEGLIIASDINYQSRPNSIGDFEKKETIINNTLRGGHTAYVYASGELKIGIKKQDINWYNGTDELFIDIYDMEQNLVGEGRIDDDGIDGIDKNKAKIQEKQIVIPGIKEGVYKIEFSNFDGLIKEIRINSNKIIFERVFLADNEIYGTDKKQNKLYFNSKRMGQINVLTYHNAGLQEVSYENDVDFGSIHVINISESANIELKEGGYNLFFNENDVIVSGPGYFSFSKEQYFEPFKNRVLDMKNDIEWLKGNVDYIVTDYKSPKVDGNWIISEAEFDLIDDGLYVNDGKLSMVFNIPHLGNEAYENYTIPIDWINIKVHKPGIIK